MTELYLRLLDRILTPTLLLLSIFFFLRGHNLPGGGFIAGLVAAAAFQLEILSQGEIAVRKRIGWALQPVAGIGLLLAIGAGIVGIFDSQFFKGLWVDIPLGPLGNLEIGTPVIFDLGVFLAVAAVVISYLLGLNHVAEASDK
jgi:multisubunit Na+/H+ antiporter MnhB subunit